MTKDVKKIIGFLYCLVFCTVIAVGMPQMTKAAEETFTGASGKSGDLEWSITEEGNLTITGKGNYEIINIDEIILNGPEWLKYREHIYTAKINVKDITSTMYMFANCKKLYSLDLSNLDTSNVTNMSSMFWNCISLSYVDLSKFNTSNVTQMGTMFSNCISLSNLNISNFDTSNVIEMQAMFSKCENLKSLDVSNFDTSNTELMGYMFGGCSGLKNLDLNNFDTGNVTDMSGMFIDCSNLINLNLSKFDTNNVMYMSGMFRGCSSLKSLDLSNFNDSKITLLNYFNFDNLNALEKIYFFKDSLHEYTLPSLTDYRWINEDNEICTKTVTLDRKMIYTRVGKDYDPTVTSTPAPSIEPSTAPSTEPNTTPTPAPSISPVVPSDAHIFSDYNYTNPVEDNEAIIYGNGKIQTVDGKKVNNKVFTAYTDILASYKYTLNSKSIVKLSVGKVIVGVTKSNIKPEVSSKNKITDTSASKIAKARIKNGQITVTAVGKESGLVYLWVIDTGSKGVSACCPINVKLAPTKLEIQDKSGSKLAKNTKLENGKTLDVCVTGLVGSTKTEDGTYTATVDSKYQSYITVASVEGNTNKFTINAKGLKNNKDTKVTITFKCNQNSKKTNLSLTITK